MGNLKKRNFVLALITLQTPLEIIIDSLSYIRPLIY